jgi:ABC-type sugar transport system ATPase subunit
MGRTMGAGQLPAVDARVGAEGTLLDLDEVCRWFGVGDTVVKAVDDINLHVDEAAFVVVLGPSGSGKTTLLNLIGALDAPTAGTIRLNGQDLTTASRAQRTMIRRHTVSFVFQSFNLFPGLTALENVQFGADVAGRAWGARGGPGGAGPGRAGRPGGALRPSAVRRGAAAGGHRPGPGDRQPDPAGR